jgi:predicted DCC family thiol-disulfide oxidoreductase YuxK
METKLDKLVLYDGDCGFCNRSVAFILKHERTDAIRFAPIQSTFTTELFARNNWDSPDLSTFYFIDGNKKFERSAAAFEVVKFLKFPYSWLRIFRFIPRKLSDWLYNQIAKRRQRISNGFCVMPTPEQRSRFELN